MYNMNTKEHDIGCWAKIQNIQIFQIYGDQNMTSDIEQELLGVINIRRILNAKSYFICFQFYV